MQTAIVRRFLPPSFGLITTSLCLFLSSGCLYWKNAWILLGINFCSSIATMLLLWNSTELLAERSRPQTGKSWDKPIVLVMVLLGPVSTWVISGLDFRFHWSQDLGPWSLWAGVCVASFAAALVSWSMRINRFFSAVVRIQKDRGHVVITTGPYQLVRHPGYAGMAVFTLVTPLILNSRWAFIPAALTVAAAVVRTILEDRVLQKELDGYEDYSRRVRSKLLPLLW